jgi:hypothetical protein
MITAMTRAAVRVTSRSRWAIVIGLVLAAIAGVHQAVIASAPTNDDFMHVAIAEQILAGDRPFRDFFDSYGALMYGMSVIGRLLFGQRLLAEAAVVAVMLAVSTYLVFRLVRELTESTPAAVLSAALLIVAGGRGYSYPKIIIYAVAATIWWWYVREPSRLKLAALGLWVAAGFYWRADHAVYVAIAAALAVVAAHGVSRMAALRLAQAATVAVVAVSPMLFVATLTVGFARYLEDGFAVASTQHALLNAHSWPRWSIREVADVIRLDGREVFAPRVGVRWSDDATDEARAELLVRHGLTPVADDGPSVQVVRLSDESPEAIRALINEPIVADTSGIDRSQSEVSWSDWPLWQRLRFSQWWLRFRWFAGIDEHTNAAETAAALFYAMPVIVMVLALVGWHRYLSPGTARTHVIIFATLGIVTAFGLMRSPYDVRAVDGVVIPAILFGCAVTIVWRAAMRAPVLPRYLVAAACILFGMLVVKSVAVAGEFPSRVAWLTGEGRSLARMQGAWREVRDRLMAEPALSFWKGKPMSAELQLAQYAADCLPSSRRLLVLWFAPEIYYYAGRLMASRHLFYDSGYERLAREQQLTLEKIQRYAPPLVFANGGLDTYTRSLYPNIVDYVRREYNTVGTVEDNGRQYLVLLRKSEPVLTSYGERQWPCLV